MTKAADLHVVPPTAAPATPLEDLRSVLQTTFIERDDAIEALIRAAVARGHVVMLGPPGEGKSMLARYFAGCLGLSYWETLLTKFSTPDDLFGMLKMSSFQQDRYERHTTGFFQAAQVAFVDECFKGNAGVLNAMLTALNERTWTNDGKVCKLPIEVCIGASNEYIEGPELGALWDRFLVRLWVEPVKDRANRIRMMQSARGRAFGATAIAGLNLAAEQKAAAAVVFTPEVDEAFQDVREAVEKAGHHTSDRRWIQVQALVQAEAHIDGRKTARPGDIGCVADALWNEQGERAELVRVIQKVVDPTAAKATARLDAARVAFRDMPKDVATAGGQKEFLGVCASTVSILKAISSELDGMGGGRAVDKAKAEVTQLLATVGAMGLKASGFGP